MFRLQLSGTRALGGTGGPTGGATGGTGSGWAGGGPGSEKEEGKIKINRSQTNL